MDKLDMSEMSEADFKIVLRAIMDLQGYQFDCACLEAVRDAIETEIYNRNENPRRNQE